MLPGHSGFEVLAELRRREETRDVGVLLLTARKDEPDRIKGPRSAPTIIPAADCTADCLPDRDTLDSWR